MFVLRRRFVRVAVITLTAGLAGCAVPAALPQSLAELASRSLAQIDGKLEVPDLREPVESIRDEWGIPHIRIVDLADLDRSVASNAPGQSAQPGSPYYGNLVENLGSGEYFPLLYTRGAVEEQAAHRLRLQPGSR